MYLGNIENFANLMNEKALALGLTSTHFTSPHGLDNDEHYTTAYELALITNYALNNEIFCQYVSTKSISITINGYSKILNNTNELLGNLNGVYGVKTGFTNGANRCLVTSVKRDNMDIICIVLGADTKKDRTQDSIKLIEFIFKYYKPFNIKEKINTEFNNWILCNCNSFSVSKGVSNELALYLDNLNYDYFPLNSNQISSLNIYIYCNYNYTAPLSDNSIVGYLYVNIYDTNVLTLAIRNKNYIGKKNVRNFYIDIIKNYSYNLESIFYNK